MHLMISTYTAPLDQVDAARAAHMEWLEGLEKRGLVVTAGRQDPPIGGIVLLATDSREEAVAQMADDPYVLRGLATYTATGWKPTRGALADWQH